MNEVFIIAFGRTPIGSFGGAFKTLSATQLGAQAIRGTIEKFNINKSDIDEVLMGNVLSANLGQAPAKQAAIYAGISESVPTTTINKVCSSGMKALTIGAQSILAGDNHLVVTGGMENMSSVPYYLDGARSGYRLGHKTAIDGLIKDGLTDVYNDYHMGNAAELCASECGISREEQDKFAIESYKRSQAAWENGNFQNEIIPVEVPQRKGEPVIVDTDEEFTNVDFDKLPSLRPVFQKDGTVTAANASTLNDGAACIVLASGEYVKNNNITPLAKILSYADASQKPEWFTTAPAKALPLAIQKSGLSTSDIGLYEINEAFSVVSLANMQQLKLNPDIVNVHGGAVSLGHPLGCSGSRVVVTLLNAMLQRDVQYGAAGICNGGGGATAVIIQKL